MRLFAQGRSGNNPSLSKEGPSSNGLQQSRFVALPLHAFPLGSKFYSRKNDSVYDSRLLLRGEEDWQLGLDFSYRGAGLCHTLGSLGRVAAERSAHLQLNC